MVRVAPATAALAVVFSSCLLDAPLSGKQALWLALAAPGLLGPYATYMVMLEAGTDGPLWLAPVFLLWWEAYLAFWLVQGLRVYRLENGH